MSGSLIRPFQPTVVRGFCRLKAYVVVIKEITVVTAITNLTKQGNNESEGYAEGAFAYK